MGLLRFRPSGQFRSWLRPISKRLSVFVGMKRSVILLDCSSALPNAPSVRQVLESKLALLVEVMTGIPVVESCCGIIYGE
jgi:hypothetical protein